MRNGVNGHEIFGNKVIHNNTQQQKQKTSGTKIIAFFT